MSGSFGVLGWTPPPGPVIATAHPHQISKLDPFFPAPAGGGGSGMTLGEGTKEVHEATGTHYGWEP